MSKKLRKYKDKAIRAEFSETNNLGVREYKSKVFKKHNTRKRNERDAIKWINKIEKIWEEKRTLTNENITFADYVKEKKNTHLKEAVIRNGKRIEGLKGFDEFVIHYLNPVVDHFGKAKIRLITPYDIDVYRSKRLNTPTYKGTERSIASVNRELSLLRKIFNLALRDRIINFAPKFLISVADEVSRERILTDVEQSRLMLAFENKSKQGRKTLKHLKPIIVTALDTACRFGELKNLEWTYIDFERKIITLIASNTKTAKQRIIPMSDRVIKELNHLYESRTTNFVFNVKDIKNGWKRLCKLADIENCRFHDLRHTATTKFVRSGMRTEVAMAITGHTELRTFRRYLNFSAEDLSNEFKKVAEI
ncbi:MAG: site-specific integrase [Acidobacteriota bacterium]|nr:site-specific integrase [Acidobacteriota bacterium]